MLFDAAAPDGPIVGPELLDWLSCVRSDCYHCAAVEALGPVGHWSVAWCDVDFDSAVCTEVSFLCPFLLE